MSYKCPLCLNELTEGDQLVRFCTDHPQLAATTVTIHESEESLPDEIYCRGGGGRCNNSIHPGVFLSHIGCQAKNPFWDGSNVDIPGGSSAASNQSNDPKEKHSVDNVTDYQMTTPSGIRTIKVTHWEIGILKMVPASEEMWFPLMLLRATGETYRNRNKERERVGVLVELAGTRKVGKTVLAMQAMEYEGYTPDTSNDERHVEVTGFMFSRLPPGSTVLNSPFLATLYYNNLMMRNEPGLFLLGETAKMPGDVKAAFISPSMKATLSRSRNSNAGLKPGGKRGFVKAIRSNVWQMIKGVGEIFWSPSGPHSFWYTVAFYDVAGESFISGTTPDDIERVVDKVAILVDAEEIFGISSGNSIAVANERISKVAKQRQLPHCLVVTKLDLVMDRLSDDHKEKVREIAENLNSERSEEARSLLMSWLNQRRDNDSIKQLKNRLRTIDHVFFVWTESLPTSTSQGTVQTLAQQPRSYGLAKFICWCLNITWDEINQE